VYTLRTRTVYPQAVYSIHGSPIALTSYWCPEDFLDAASFGLQRNSGM
jgi:hypothetical protein